MAAVRFAIEHDFDYLLNLDGDFSHPPRFIPDLAEGNGRRHNHHDQLALCDWRAAWRRFNLKRKLMSSGINGYARVTLGLTSRDNSGAFRCYRVSKLAEIDLDQVRSRGYSFQEEILYRCKSVGCRIGETPILFENRRAGVSKINMREAVSALWILFALGVGRVTGSNGTKDQAQLKRGGTNPLSAGAACHDSLKKVSRSPPPSIPSGVGPVEWQASSALPKKS